MPDGAVTHAFVGPTREAGGMIVVITRGGSIRTLFPIRDLVGWQQRHSEMIEVTDRARQPRV
jgi:hypothetical protein